MKFPYHDIHCWKGLFLIVTVLLVLNAGCGDDMRNQPRFEPLEQSDFFEDGRSSRPLVEGTVPRGFLRDDDHLYTGKIKGEYADQFPFEMDAKALKRGQQRYDIYCAVCHDRLGTGQGMVVRRGFKQPPSFHDDRLRAVAPGYLYEVMTNGFGTMGSYAEQINPVDRWAIAGYIRVLQHSQNVKFSDLTKEEKAKVS